jgi:hypothetical protein
MQTRSSAPAPPGAERTITEISTAIPFSVQAIQTIGQSSGGSGAAIWNYGATAYAGDNVAGVPAQDPSPVVAGAYIGGGVTFMFANTASGAQLAGPFETIAGNASVGAGASVSLSFDRSGDFVLQLTFGPGIGLSGWAITTNTCVTGHGCQ